MKKLLVMMAAAGLLLCGTLPVWAEGEPAADKSAANAAAMLEYWTQEALAAADPNDPDQVSAAYSFPYPDCINGVWSTDGTMDRLTFACVQGRRAEAEAELACIEDQSGVTLVEGGPHTIKELREVDIAVREYAGQGSGIAGWGIDQQKNIVRVDMVMSEEGAQATKDALQAAFGGKIGFNEVGGYAQPAAGVDAPAVEVIRDPLTDNDSAESDALSGDYITVNVDDLVDASGVDIGGDQLIASSALTAEADQAETAKCGTPNIPAVPLIAIIAAAAALCAVVYFAVKRNKE